MKIYFDGCSWTQGAELKDINKRYSKIISNHYKAEEYNIAENGGCNRRIVRNILDHNIDDFDLFVIQMTMHSRTEYYDGDLQKFIAVKTAIPHHLSEEKRNYWSEYYEKIYQKKYGVTDEKIYYNLIKKILRDKKHIIVTCARESHVPFDIDISLLLSNNKRSNFLRTRGQHPNILGHKLIAETLINLIDKT